ncbi:MAG: TadE/TadG family type IV pilus assembly protein [Chloroflexota bacterium]
MSAAQARGQPGLPWYRRAQRGSALIETALVLPILLTLVFGLVGIARLAHARMGLSAVAREEARAGALADTPGDATSRGLAAGQAVASGYGLSNGSLQLSVEPGALDRGGDVLATAAYTVHLGDLPLMHWLDIPMKSQHVERADLYRSRWNGAAGS